MTGHYHLDEKYLNTLQIKTLNTMLSLIKKGTKYTDVHVRKNGIEYIFQADFLNCLDGVGVTDIEDDLRKFVKSDFLEDFDDNMARIKAARPNTQQGAGQ